MTPCHFNSRTASPTPEQSDSPLRRILVLLRVGLHVSFAFFLCLGAIQTLADRKQPLSAHHTLLMLGLVGVLAAVYLVGTTWEKRAVASNGTPTFRTQPTLAPWWLILVTALWVALVAVSSSFVWLLFPLAFIYLHIIPLPINLLAVALGWAFAAFIPMYMTPETWTPSAAVGPGVGSIFATVVYFTYQALGREIDRQTQLSQQLIAAQQELAEKEHQAGRLEERERLSREIHDTVAQGLSSILLLSRAAQNELMHGDTDTAREQLHTIHEQAGASLSEARRFVRDLASPDLSDPLPQALQRVVARAAARDTALGIDRDYSLEVVGDENHPVPEPVSRAIIRVVQEAISNIHKHSTATKAVITVGIWEEEVSIDVMDNGHVDHTPDPGFGITGLKKRIADLGGNLTVEFGLNDGEAVALTCRIPLTSRRDD
ncbi:MAG: sensor histidine kinase [Corynebacterium sp.]|uniref:sensor histidine kinase n=1 Tax=Corynebacterium sp. TaxID=1720 RepID=UPI0026DC949B|nr:sensor histidine kinase [Corynebacterium sp.]MDO5098818.1 sensor histidine kinase [Corynebacterium sp.]